MTWLTVKEAAPLCGVSESAIKKAVKQGKYKYCYVDGVGRGGKQLRVALESLPDAAQARYRGEQEQQAADVRLSLTGSQLEKLDFKQMVVLDYQDFKATYPKADKI